MRRPERIPDSGAETSLAAGTHQPTVERLTELIHELLDAHSDTVCLAKDRGSGPEWAAHLAYLQGLQRAGQLTLAELAA